MTSCALPTSNTRKPLLLFTAMCCYVKAAVYRMQARIGGMDGIFVAHHNTKEMFGFQYVPLEDMDECTSGSYEAAERTFKLGVAIMEEALQTVMEHVTVEVSAGETCSASAD